MKVQHFVFFLLFLIIKKVLYLNHSQACRENHVDVVSLLVDNGCSVNANFPNSRENPLTLAAEKGTLCNLQLATFVTFNWPPL